MTHQNAKQYLPLVQALAEGKTIQKKIKRWENDSAWVDWKEPNFTLPASCYRIKPAEPRRIWEHKYEIDGCTFTGTSDTLDCAVANLRKYGGTITEFVEVVK